VTTTAATAALQFIQLMSPLVWFLFVSLLLRYLRVLQHLQGNTHHSTRWPMHVFTAGCLHACTNDYTRAVFAYGMRHATNATKTCCQSAAASRGADGPALPLLQQ
jgi:hypothetical protein